MGEKPHPRKGCGGKAPTIEGGMGGKAPTKKGVVKPHLGINQFSDRVG